ncbi:methyltransferase domain-containing protein [Patescibacteria group bacterium]|nr:methyltransferase domain-containing protein [Patescibacteria group bacterium]
MSLVNFLVEEGWIKSDSIKEAFKKIKRKDFLPEASKDLAEINEALPIGQNQTISQPAVVAFMLEELQAKKGDKILDIGSGSGWTTALLSHIAGDKVFAIEIVPELKEFGQENVKKYGLKAKFILGNGKEGLPSEAPFDRILASATGNEIPPAWKEQLKVGGKIVAPIGNSIKTLLKKSNTEFEEIDHPGFVFVPLL